MINNLKQKLKESAFSVLPVTFIVLGICLFFVQIPGSEIVKFVISSVLLLIGIALFSMGADMSMMPIGQSIAASLTKSKKLLLLFLSCSVMGLIITIAEPDLTVLANQVPTINKWLFVMSVGIGVGLCFLLGTIRIIFKIPFHIILTIGYILVFILMFFVSKNFWALSFDASGVTTGAISVPFIMSFCLGISAMRGGNSSEEDGFGLVAICSLGPILSVLILGIFIKDITITGATTIIESGYDSMARLFGTSLISSLKDVALVLLPILAIFLIFQLTIIKLPKTQIYKILIGVLYTYIGIVLFMVGVNVGFSSLGRMIGEKLMESQFNYLIYPISFVLGYIIVLAEPAVHILTSQVAFVSGNTIRKKILGRSLSIGVGLSLTIATLRAVLNINIMWFILPIFALSLILSFYNPKLFTAVAFDAGGIASGPMSATFLLPFVAGIASIATGNAISGAFGTVALIASTPILVIQILGAIAKYTRDKTAKQAAFGKKITILEYDY